jgi:very-short-patch-repair endonuclease
MTSSAELVRVVSARGGVIARRHHPELSGAIDWAVRNRELRPVLPGVYAVAALADQPLTRMRAACLRHPNGVLLTGAAARASFWPKAPVDAIRVAAPIRVAAQPGFAFTRRRIPPELVAEEGGLRFTIPALTAIDMSTFSCTDAIDRALRTRAATLPMMYEALARTANRIGNPERTRLLLDSRDLPWSAAERLAHNILRRAGVRGWKANVAVFLEGRWYYIDIAFRWLKVAIEIDGRLHEDDEDLFESDRWRQNALVRDGWRVLRFTWDMLREHPEAVIAAVLAVIA